ncbi:MAG: hypothetical protein MUF87_20295 [Anaerolineae bacterium]|jgi:hypothetical protein|nr:hypothetical protein [Anaerolineae bacterium]
MKKLRIFLFLTILATASMLVQGGGGSSAIPKDNMFAWTSLSGNVTANYTTVDHLLTNANDQARLFVTPSYGVGGTSNPAIYYNRGHGVWYNNITSRWTIFNQDSIAMSSAINAAFHVEVRSPSANTFNHVSTASNISAAVTYIDHPLTNNTPSALVFITPTLTANGITYNYTNKALGVFYSNSQNKWAIFFQDQSAMATDLAFNVYVLNAGGSTYIHEATTASYITTLNHPMLNNNPFARMTVTQNYTPNGVYNDHQIGVWYNSGSGRWTVFNQDISPMTIGAAFNINILEDNTEVVRQDLLNGSFEVESGVDNSFSVPQGWFASNTSLGYRFCNLYGVFLNASYAGDCTLVMVGAPSNSATFAQTYRPPVGSNRTAVEMSAMVRGIGQASGATIFARVFFTNGGRGILRLSSTDINAGTYAWKYIYAQRDFGQAIQRVRISIVTQDPTGTLYVDNVRLETYNPTLRGDEAPLIPMP